MLLSRADSNYPFLTQKERDIETGLDYFNARYYSSVQGRFMSADEFTGGAHDLSYFDDIDVNPTFYAELAAPQSLNKYQYCLNNPLRFVDPDGHQPEAIAERLLNSPAGQQLINAAGGAVTVTIVAASGAPQKVWDWLTTPNPNFKMNTFCGNGLDCSAAFKQVNQDSASPTEGSTNETGRGSRNPSTAEAAKEGREQHKNFGEKVKAKPGWKSEPTLTDPKTGRPVRPDAVSPGGRPVELKPNTPSGRAQGRRQLPGQERATGKRGRVVYYEPKRKKPDPQ